VLSGLSLVRRSPWLTPTCSAPGPGRRDAPAGCGLRARPRRIPGPAGDYVRLSLRGPTAPPTLGTAAHWHAARPRLRDAADSAGLPPAWAWVLCQLPRLGRVLRPKLDLRSRRPAGRRRHRAVQPTSASLSGSGLASTRRTLTPARRQEPPGHCRGYGAGGPPRCCSSAPWQLAAVARADSGVRAAGEPGSETSGPPPGLWPLASGLRHCGYQRLSLSPGPARQGISRETTSSPSSARPRTGVPQFHQGGVV